MEIVSAWPSWAAKDIGVAPLSIALFTSTPPEISTSRTFAWPLSTAATTAEAPSGPKTSVGAPASRSWIIIGSAPFGSWLEVLREDNRAVVCAASQARGKAKMFFGDLHIE